MEYINGGGVKNYIMHIAISLEYFRGGKALYGNVYPKFSVRDSWRMMIGKLIGYEVIAA